RRYASVIRSRRDIFIIAFEEDRDFHFYAVKFVHAIGGKRVEFSMESESDGTHRLFQLLEILVGRKEKVYVMDEMSRSLHPKLTVQFVRKYLAGAAGRRVQLITTTHESRLMSHDLVRRDEIWIADLNDDGSTRLFSLEDEQVRIDKVLDQNYMDNVWGGVPVFEGEED
ncbi:MAG: AAA family ATPase, partial [Treponema sp.]|nr:AAA family ATPase [Treponema sp.]